MTVEAGSVLDVTGLSVDYNRRGRQEPGLRDLSFRVSQGEFVAVVGESGSGKSTLANAIIGLLPDNAIRRSGAVRLLGHDLAALRPRELDRVRGKLVSFIPQDPGQALNPVQRVGAQLAEVLRVHGERLSDEALHARVIALFGLVGIDRPEERARQYPHELSGGLKQRVLIAIAFALEPQLIVADEPTSALDVTVQRQVLATFDTLVRQRGTAVVFVTHDIALAADHASRIVVLKDGVLAEDFAVADLRRVRHAPYTSLLLDEAFRNDRPDRPDRPKVAGDARAPVLVVDSLRKEYRIDTRTSVQAVRNVSFTVSPGTTTAIVGESGSGKSTIAKLLLRLIDPTAGSISVLGRDVTLLRGRQRRTLWRSLQLVHQNPDSSLDPRASVADIVGEPLRAQRIGDRTERARRVAEVVSRVGLPGDALAKRPGELSGGQRQRVAIARALVLEPRIVVLDEPLSALDVVTQEQVLTLLDRLQRDLGLTYLIISHDLSVVRRVSDQIVVMRAGEMVERGSTERIFRSPQDPYTVQLLEARPGHRLRDPARLRESARTGY